MIRKWYITLYYSYLHPSAVRIHEKRFGFRFLRVIVRWEQEPNNNYNCINSNHATSPGPGGLCSSGFINSAVWGPVILRRISCQVKVSNAQTLAGDSLENSTRLDLIGMLSVYSGYIQLRIPSRTWLRADVCSTLPCYLIPMLCQTEADLAGRRAPGISRCASRFPKKLCLNRFTSAPKVCLVKPYIRAKSTTSSTSLWFTHIVSFRFSFCFPSSLGGRIPTVRRFVICWIFSCCESMHAIRSDTK